MSLRTCLKSTVASFALFGTCIAIQPAIAQRTVRTSSNVGRVTHLSDKSDNALLGHIYAFDKSADDAFEALGDGDLKSAVQAARNMGRAANEIADKVAEAQENLGEAAARLQISHAQFERLDAETSPNPPARQQLLEDLSVFRDMLASRLASLRERYRAMDGKDELQKEALRKQMAAIVTRIENFDEIRQTIQQGRLAVVPDSATAWMKLQLDEMENALAEEEAALQLTATAMRIQLAETAREVERSFRLIELQSRLPSEQIRRLRMTQASTKKALSKLVQEHQRATEAVLSIIGSGHDGPPPPEKELLERIDGLLGNATATTDSED